MSVSIVHDTVLAWTARASCGTANSRMITADHLSRAIRAGDYHRAANALQHTIIEQDQPQRASYEQIQLIPIRAHPHAAPPSIANQLAITQSVDTNCFNDPAVHFYRDVFSHLPGTKVREVSHMLIGKDMLSRADAEDRGRRRSSDTKRSRIRAYIAGYIHRRWEMNI